MTARAKVGLVVAVLFCGVNLGGAGYAAAQGEPLHAALHAGLLLVGVFPVWRLGRRSFTRGVRLPVEPVLATLPAALPDRLTHLEHSVDAVALEVERIGEGQRFVTRIFADNGMPQPGASGASHAGDVDSGNAPPRQRRS